jgi:hypothetical protein
MKLIEIQAREIVAIYEFTISELEKIKIALDCTELKPETDEEKESVSYLTNSVYPSIMKAIEEVKGKEK